MMANHTITLALGPEVLTKRASLSLPPLALDESFKLSKNDSLKNVKKAESLNGDVNRSKFVDLLVDISAAIMYPSFWKKNLV